MMRKTMISALLLACVLGVRAYGQEWGSGVAAPEPGKLSLTLGFERLNQAFEIDGIEERLRRDMFRARVDLRPGDVLSLYGFIGSADISGSLDSLRALSYGGGMKLLFLGEIVVEEKNKRPMEVKLGAALDFKLARFSPESGNRGPGHGLTQLQAGLDLGLTVMGVGGHLGFFLTGNSGELPYRANLAAEPASGLNFSLALGLHYKLSRHLGLAAEWSFFGLRSFGVGLRLYP